MRSYLFATLALCTTSILASEASIVDAIEKVASSTAALNASVLAWSGDLLGVLGIVADSATVLVDLGEGYIVAEQSANLTDLESIGVYEATLALSSDLNLTLASVEDAYSKFEALLLTGAILLDLEADKAASDKFSAAILSKVPTALVSIAEEVVDGIDAAFDEAIDAYETI